MSDHVTVSRTIAASPEKVWALVSDITRMGDWSPETTSCKWTNGDGPEVGARFAGSNAIGRRKWSTKCEVMDCEPGKSFSFESKAGPLLIARWSYTFQPTDGGTLVTESMVDHRGLAMKVLGPLATGIKDRAAHNRANMEKTLEALDAAATA